MSDLFSPRFAPPPPSPPPAPPLPPARYVNRATNALARFAQPFIGAARPASAQAQRTVNPVRRITPAAIPNFTSPLSSQSTTHKTGIPIAAVDISPQRTHAVVAGREIFKTIRVSDATCAEEVNLRTAIIAYASTHHSGFAGPSSRLKDNLAAVDVKWSHGQYSSCVATAAANGRVQLYDINRAGVELASLHEHHRQVHKLAFNPHQGAYLLSASQDATVRLWDLRALVGGGRSVLSFRSARKYATNAEGVRDVKWSPTEGTEFACGTDAGAVQRWDFRRESAPLLKVMAHQSGCHSVDWHPDGKHLVSGGPDKSVRVWDFSREDRKQNASWTFRAPHPVVHVRWRPAEWTMNPHGQSAWETAQVVTTYSHQEPRVHIWHLRRPHVPFKEIDQYNSAPTDLLWHSPDLLWTVGLEGIFTQTDVHFAVEPAARRRVRCFDTAPDGEITFFTQKGIRPGISLGPGPGFSMPTDPGPSKPSSGEKLSGSRSTTDDDANPGFLGAPFKMRPSRTWSAKSSKSAGNTPPSEQFEVVVRKLDEILDRRVAFEPAQIGAQGYLPTGSGADSLARLASRYYLQSRAIGHELSEERTKMVENEIETNARLAEREGLYRIAQTWRLLGLALAKEQHDALERQTRRIQAQEAQERERRRVQARETQEAERQRNHAHEVLERIRQQSQAQGVGISEEQEEKTVRGQANEHREAEEDLATPHLALPDSRAEARTEAASENRLATDQVERHDFAVSAAPYHDENPPSALSPNIQASPLPPRQEHDPTVLPQPRGRSLPPASDTPAPFTPLRNRTTTSSSILDTHGSPNLDPARSGLLSAAPDRHTPSPLALFPDIPHHRNGKKRMASTPPPSTEDSSPDNPFSTARLLEKAVDYYLIDQSDVFTPTAMFLFLGPFCPRINLDPFRVSAMLRTLHDQLMQHTLFVEATHLRNICYAEYKPVFEFTQEDVDIKFGCTDCQTQLDPVWYPGLESIQTWTCRKCQKTPTPCPLCCSSVGMGWWAWCPGCGHGGHASCLTEWWQDNHISEVGCPTEGCLHDCAQPRTKRSRMEEPISAMKDRGRPAVRSDDWVVGESKAVERVRGGLAAASGLGKPEKRVKVVTPGEEEEEDE
ncbi:MAG: hypothetical protein M1823_005797 [Watsoniomyces obsoletus]|nr:MAG: hypothetical protein M1823_005797 [Watsoniomyces obsoletus]